MRSKSLTVVEQIAQELRTRTLSVPEGAYLGSEISLAREFGVTGPTLRQATRLLEHEETLKVRRGVKGGYYAHRPRIETVSRVSAIYLRGHLHDYDEVLRFLEHQMPLLVDLVMASDRLAELAPFAEPPCREFTYGELVAWQTDFISLLWDIAGNAPLRLIGAIFLQVGLTVQPGVSQSQGPPQTVSSGALRVHAMRVDLAGALLAGDRHAAITLAVEQCRMVHEGLKVQLSRGQSAE